MKWFGFMFLLLLLLPAFCLALGTGDWEARTPGGNVMYDDGSGPKLRVIENQGFGAIKEWYFYKDHIVLKTMEAWLVVDDVSGGRVVFEQESAWENYLKAHQLKPKLWTRWYADNWRFYERMSFPGLLIGGILLIFLFIELMAFVAAPVAKKRWSFKRKHFYILVALILLAWIRLKLDVYPQSF
jgi:hypothetical protein